jgi:hypothetical protein
VTLGVLAPVAASSNPDYVGAGLLGFLVFAAMAVALVFLVRSMNKQFRKITPHPGPSLPDDEEDKDSAHTPD